LWSVVKARLGAAVVEKHIADVIQDYVEDNEESFPMRGVHQFSQLVVRVVRILGETRLSAQES